jgi:FdhD protein
VNAIRTGHRFPSAILGVESWRCEHGEALAARADELSVEEPLEIRVTGETLAVTMRTPGHDRELAAGFLLAERLVRSRAELGGIVHCGRLGHEGYGNVIDVTPAPGVVLELEALAGARRGTLTTSACGVCGRRLVDDLVASLVPPAPVSFEPAFIASLAGGLRAEQPHFERTGGLHAAGIAEPSAGFLVVREDVGRHNAVDKAVGRLLLDDRLPASGSALVVSGRTSFEIVQKAVAAGIPAVVGISAPSSLAVATAARFGVLLCGFARGGAFNVYTGAERLARGATP